MRIQRINPNTTDDMTARMAVAARQVASAGTRILAVQSLVGSASFSVVTTLQRTVPTAERLLPGYGMVGCGRRVRAALPCWTRRRRPAMR